MKTVSRILTVAVLILFTTTAWGKAEQEAKDVAQIKILLDQIVKAWNRADAQALKTYWAENGDMIATPGSLPTNGRAAVGKQFETDLNGRYKDSKVSLTVTNIKFLSKDVALVDARNEFTGIHTAGGTDLPPLQSHFIFLTTRNHDKWEVNSFRWFSTARILPVEVEKPK